MRRYCYCIILSAYVYNCIFVYDSFVLQRLSDYISDEMNALSVTTSTDVNAWTTMSVVPDSQALGRRLGPAFKKVLPLLRSLPQASDGGGMRDTAVLLLLHLLSSPLLL